MPTLVVAVFLAFFAAEYAVETGLLLLNLRRARRSGDAVPAPLQGVVTPGSAARSRDYTLANGRLALVSGAWSAALTLAVLLSGLLPWLHQALAARGLAGAHRFVAFLVLVSAPFWVAGLPFALYRTFVLEARFGFNRTTPALWLKDRAKGLLLSAALGLPLLYAVYGFMALTGRAWWLWLAGFLTGVQILMVWLFPTLIAPLFNRFQPLPEGPLKERLEALARAARFRSRGLFVMDASRRSGHGNAYFTGFFRPRIVLFDTLVAQMTVPEAAAVLAHEIGHYQKRHVHRRLALGVAGQVVTLWALSLLVPWPPLYRAFGFAAPSYEAALALFSLGGGAFTFFLAPVASWLSRRHEYQADRYAVALVPEPGALASALVKLNRENLANLDPHPWYSAWHYSHPTLVERLRAIGEAGRPA
ncbi:M48 family metallopeptidase [Anaeromyxobacter paludicola]|uniref:Peptidase M48 n=1 Tax=Anaeromyxobacter paludicola TaxID=2918171 RepID=A0ABM7X625_9BACT|nr:M48 family metallopeptidase [Anaeromyxobacter paludicola]BDG07261.1 peptidase M48 [Anaeromyxobacter paludicola]